MINATRIVPASFSGPKRVKRPFRGNRMRGPLTPQRHPENSRIGISEVFSMDDEEYTETDFLVDHVLRRGSIRGRCI